uniref:PiggyBac transposable element-derived protein domain-containing protein n=1 Tax=Clastoptera arizonana TaxID=38151 RepID=A0A1B6CV45_9HEMI
MTKKCIDTFIFYSDCKPHIFAAHYMFPIASGSVAVCKSFESHYNRQKKPEGVYLNSDLSINKLCTIYNTFKNSENLKVTRSMSRQINILKIVKYMVPTLPASDICGYA